LAILQQHANGTPPSAIGRNSVSVVKATAPWLQPMEYEQYHSRRTEGNS